MFAEFGNKIKEMKIGEIITQQLHDSLNSIHSDICSSNNKLKSAGKFIDYFIHDMLDYSLLSKDKKNFVK